MTTIALVGNPNCGKTTVFNGLTGTRQRVGNWPGVTVEKKVGSYRHGDSEITVVDLPGTYSIEGGSEAIDEQIARHYLNAHEADLIVNVIDAASLARGLYLTLELLERGLPVIVALNMMDVAHRHGHHIDVFALSNALGVPVVPIIASRREGLGVLQDAIEAGVVAPPAKPSRTAEARYAEIDQLLEDVLQTTTVRRTLSDRIDAVLLNRFLAFPVFLLVMYLMFMFSINFGSAFIDFFDGVGAVLFVEGPRLALTYLNLPEWLVVLIADGVGGGIQLVGTFIPVIGCLFIALAFLEDSGYLGRVAFIIDRLMRRLGLPGKSFVPLIVGFGCNVPAVMATRALDREPDRILTTIMAPYMSCGARLTVYALFAAAFFPDNGQNIVFGLYLIGIAVAVLSALAVRRYLIAAPVSTFVMELPPYHWPTLKGVAIQAWQRLSGFIVRAGKAIVAVVVILNVVSSVGTDGSFNNQNSEKSVLSAIGRTITPVFAPMGITADNWPATVGIFTGIFAKEVVVGTLDALYAAPGSDASASLSDQLVAAVKSVPENLADLTDAALDPLGINLGDTTDLASQVDAQKVELTTVSAMQQLFDGRLGAFAYLLFILLYMPCVATIGVIYKEIGRFWAMFSTAWSVTVAYCTAVIVYQAGALTTAPATAVMWMAAAASLAAVAFALLLRWGRARQQALIPVVHLD